VYFIRTRRAASDPLSLDGTRDESGGVEQTIRWLNHPVFQNYLEIWLEVHLCGEPNPMVLSRQRIRRHHDCHFISFGNVPNVRYSFITDFQDVDDMPAVEAAMAEPDVRLLWAESIANPAGSVCDIGALAEAAHAVDVPLVIDNTAATPYLCKPIDHGADIVVHSTTKYISGHGQVRSRELVGTGCILFIPRSLLSNWNPGIPALGNSFNDDRWRRPLTMSGVDPDPTCRRLVDV
jgi:hypothetical protein